MPPDPAYHDPLDIRPDALGAIADALIELARRALRDRASGAARRRDDSPAAGKPQSEDKIP